MSFADSGPDPQGDLLLTFADSGPDPWGVLLHVRNSSVRVPAPSLRLEPAGPDRRSMDVATTHAAAM